MNMKRHAEKQETMVKDWNEKYPVGTVVIVTKDDETEVLTKTVHAATVVGGTAVAWLEAISGCYDLDRVRPDSRGISTKIRIET
jgi:hypothetical protein